MTSKFPKKVQLQINKEIDEFAKKHKLIVRNENEEERYKELNEMIEELGYKVVIQKEEDIDISGGKVTSTTYKVKFEPH